MNKSKYSNLSKDELEKLKLTTEIKAGSQPFLVRNFSSFVLLILTCASLSVGIYTGLFKTQRATLELDIKMFQSEKDSLQTSVKKLKTKLKDYSTIVDDLEADKNIANVEEKKAKEELVNSKKEHQIQIEEFKNIENEALADKEKVKQLTKLILTYEKSSEQNISTINSLNINLQEKNQDIIVLQKSIKQKIGQIVVNRNVSQINYNAIIGQIVDENEMPIEDAIINFKKHGEGSYKKGSNKNGQFSVHFKSGNKGRTFPVEITKDGYEKIKGFIVVGSTVKIFLKKAPITQ